MKHFRISKLLLVLILALSLPVTLPDVRAESQADTYYVDPDGSDDTGNGSQGNPWQTIQHAADQMQTGDTVLINPGNYDGNIILEEKIGTDTEPITFRANSAPVIITGREDDRWNDAFVISESTHIILEGLTIQNAVDDGLYIANSDYVTIRDCTFANNGNRGIFTAFSDYTTIENCESYGAEDEHGIYISNSSDHPIISSNILYSNHGCGLHMNGDASMGGDGIISGALVENNIIYNNSLGGGSGINMDGVTDSLIRNNLLYNNHQSGISLYQIDGGSGSQNNLVLNNTIIVASDGEWAINIPNTNDTGNKIFNNFLYNEHGSYGSILIAEPNLGGFESNYNIVMNRFRTAYEGEIIPLDGEDGWQSLGYDQNSFIATPDEVFVDPDSDDYHLRNGSLAIDKGTILSEVTNDLEGNLRPMGNSHDIGAYEYPMQAPDFSLSAEPETSRILPGGVAIYTLSIQPSGGFNAPVTLSTDNPAPMYLDIALSPSSLTPPGNAVLTVTDNHSGSISPVETYTILFTSNSGSIEHNINLTLRVGDNLPPNPPTNPSPANSATDVSITSSLNWQDSDPDDDPLSYTVALGTTNPPSTVANVDSPIYTPTLAINTTYYWQISASDGISTTVGPLWQFTTSSGSGPDDTDLYLPLIMKEDNSTTPNPTATPHPTITPTPGDESPVIEGCAIYPNDHIWNVPIDTMPIHANSAAFINSIGSNEGLHADFGSGTWEGALIGIPYVTVPGTQPRVNVSFRWPDESDPGPYPIPPDPPIEGGSDRHILVLDRDNCVLYEVGDASLQSNGSWSVGAGAIFDLKSYELRPETWTSADAAGLPILPGLVRYDEVAAGEINHAIRFTVNQSRREYVWPARHFASSLTGSQYPPMGQRFRLKADYDISGFSPQIQVILQAMKTYGLILADNGSDWFISGVPDERWDNDMLHEMDVVTGGNFEAVDVSSLMIDPDSGQARR